MNEGSSQISRLPYRLVYSNPPSPLQQRQNLALHSGNLMAKELILRFWKGVFPVTVDSSELSPIDLCRSLFKKLPRNDNTV